MDEILLWLHADHFELKDKNHTEPEQKDESMWDESSSEPSGLDWRLKEMYFWSTEAALFIFNL